MTTTTDDASPYRLEGRPRSRGLARALSPLVAVAPWLLTVAGIALAGEWQRGVYARGERSLGLLLAALVVLLLAALLWAAVTAWSSVGTVLAGVLTVVLALALGAPGPVSRAISQSVLEAGLPYRAYAVLVAPVPFLVLGTTLVAAGLAAAAARRLR
ncbi:hypothetical protein [Janibacter melonis]|uniref:hypothetical protein n=1 Tax=Janibacter melonis TaxID=262209 RepID=UPI001919FFE8|nr:hypothetical protein [Janibacter melonis]